MRAISVARLCRAGVNRSSQSRLGRITSAQINICSPGVRCGSGLARSVPTNSRQSGWSSAPLARHRCCQLSPGRSRSQPSTASTPNRRLRWLSGLSNANGAASTRSTTADRRAPVAGHDGATGRGGNAATSWVPVGFVEPVVAAGSAVGCPTCTFGGDHDPAPPKRICRLSARYPGAGGVAGSPSRRRA